MSVADSQLNGSPELSPSSLSSLTQEPFKPSLLAQFLQSRKEQVWFFSILVSLTQPFHKHVRVFYSSYHCVLVWFRSNSSWWNGCWSCIYLTRWGGDCQAGCYCNSAWSNSPTLCPNGNSSHSSPKPPVRPCLQTARLTSGLWKVRSDKGRPTVGHSAHWVSRVPCCPSFSRTVLPGAGLLHRGPVWSGANYITQNSQLLSRLAGGTVLFSLCLESIFF